MAGPLTEPTRAQARRTAGRSDEDLKRTVTQLLDRWPSGGVAVGIVRGGAAPSFFGHGVGDLDSREPITQDTAFRVGSITKTFTAVAVMQLSEQGRIDLDAPASDYLRAFRLVPTQARFGPPTVRHLLTHTAGVGYLRRRSDVLRPGVGSGDRAGRSVPALPDYYRKGLPVDVEPGTRWAYSNHGFAALGQIVEDVSGQPLDRYLRERVLVPLGMEDTDLVRSERVRDRLATGYVLRSRGLRPVADREMLTPGGSGLYSTVADLARYVAALLHGGSNEHGSVLERTSVATMFEPHFRPHPRVAGMGLGFELGAEGEHRTIAKGGTVSGFLSAMLLAPDDGIGVVVCSNTGGLDNRGIAEPLARALLRSMLGLPDSAIRADVAARADLWSRICGWYGPDAGPVTNLFARAVMGAGAEVAVRAGTLMLRPLTPIPALRHGMRLHPDDPADPLVFRAVLPGFDADLRVAFDVAPEGEGRASRLLVDMMSFARRPDIRNPRPWLQGALAVGATAAAVRRRRSAAAARRPRDRPA